MVKRIVVAICIAAALLFITKTAVCMLEGFREFLQDHPTVKVYVELKNSSKDDKIDVNLLKKDIEEGFQARRSHRFEIVKTAAEADLIMKGDVVEYTWQETDPVDEVWGFGAAAMDAAIADNYARMQVQTQLIDAKHNRALLDEKVQAAMTQHTMSKDTSYEIVYKKFVKSFLIQIFKKEIS